MTFFPSSIIRHSLPILPGILYKKDSVIFREGDPAHHWFEVESGTVRTCHFDSQGNRQLTGFYYAGDVFGIDSGVYKETAEAVIDSRIIIHRITEGESDAAFRGRQEGCGVPWIQALERARRCIVLLGRKTATAKIAAFLMELSERKSGENGFDVPMTRGDIGDHLGLTLHTVSRTMSEIGRRGLISFQGPQHVRIEDRGRLQALAGEEEAEGLGLGCSPADVEEIWEPA